MTENYDQNRQTVVAEKPSNLISNSFTIGNYLNPKTRVLIVDDLRLMLEGLEAVFVDDEDIEIVGFAQNGQEAVEKIGELKPDIVLMDLLMPVMGGVEATKLIKEKFPDVKILILSSFDDDASVSEVIAAGASGYALKSTVAKELVLAIRSVLNGSYHFAPGIMDNLAKAAFKNSDSSSLKSVAQKICTIDSTKSPKLPEQKSDSNSINSDSGTTSIVAKKVGNINTDDCQLNPIKPKTTKVKASNNITATRFMPAKALAPKKTKAKTKKVRKPKPEKPLFPYGDWAMVIFGVIFLSRIDGMGHHLGHAGLFLLMLALLARPIKGWWSQPLQHRRAVGIFAFAATVAHAIYATKNILDGNLLNMFALSSMHLWGMWAGIISLALMAPAAVTSFQSMQRKLGKKWRQIHLLTVPSLGIAVLHTVLIGPHYLANLNVDMIDHARTYAVIAVGIIVILLRRKAVWSMLKLDKIGKSAKA